MGRRPRITWPRGLREAAIALAIALAVLFVLTRFADWGVLRRLETASLDLRFRVRGAKTPEPQTVVVLVDDKSLAELGRWPLSRRLYAAAVRRLDRDGARIIAFDLLFPEPEIKVPPDLRRAARTALATSRDPDLRRALAAFAGDDPDAVFAAALRTAGNVLLPVAFSFGGTPEEAPALASQVYQRFDQSRRRPIFPLQPTRAVLPIAPLAAAASGLGHVDIAFDADGEPRYDYLALPFAGDFVPSLAVKIAASWFGVPWPKVGLALGDGVRIGRHFIPTDPAMRLVVNYRGAAATIPTYSFADLMAGRLAPSLFKNRIVLIGASFIGNADAYSGPFDNTPIPGTERLADIVDTILAGDFIREQPGPWPVLVFVLVAVLTAASGFAAARLPTRMAAAGGAASIVAWAGGAQLAFLHGIWLPVSAPTSALTAATGGVVLFCYGFVDRQRRFIQAAFRHYLAPDLVNALAAHPERMQLGGETRMLTIMFSDIRGFTAISERYKANPQALSRLINRGFLSPMTNVIMAQHGTIDKYIGDCVMAFWNAPLDDPAHADHACASALAMLAALDRINAELAGEAEAAGNGGFEPLHIGIGINTGECVVGNMGSDARFSYTAIGDAVNLAARLEGQSKTYGLSIILGDATRAAAPEWAALELDLIAVKGKAEAVRIYALLGDADHANSPGFAALAEEHAAMLAHYRARRWAAARAALARCRGRDPRLDGLYDLYVERLAWFVMNPPTADWDGVFVALTK
ncbi:MAG TPA: adenylate/guanylate cyclase domain-containing protein [Stellaceae bacterium]|nr:adenylate/guanylate cyclase domain-containing protein [Stellaceae bacterium]